ncbi:MAG: hypothetical protein ACM3S4_13540 [Burkholderiales bacterium]
MENEVRIKIGDIEFEAKGDSAIIEKERTAFFECVLPFISGKKTPYSTHTHEEKPNLTTAEKTQNGKDTSSNSVPKKSKKVKAFIPQLDKELDLRGNNNIKSFKDFYEEKKPKTNI